jgi:threonine synthase
VSDEAIANMQRRLASEGVWVEPASAAGLAGLAAQVAAGQIRPPGASASCRVHPGRLKRSRIIATQMGDVKDLPVEMGALEQAILAWISHHMRLLPV